MRLGSLAGFDPHHVRIPDHQDVAFFGFDLDNLTVNTSFFRCALFLFGKSEVNNPQCQTKGHTYDETRWPYGGMEIHDHTPLLGNGENREKEITLLCFMYRIGM